MKFHYWKQFVGILFVALTIWSIHFWAIDPLTLARSQNRQLAEYLGEARGQLETGSKALTITPDWLRASSQHINAAIIVLGDQAKSLEQLAKEDSGLDLGSIQTSLASLVVVLGAFSTILLSWRKDMRESRAELESIKSKVPKIVLP